MTADLFGPNASQVDMLMLLLDSFPGQKDGVRVPIHPKARRAWAEELLAKGVLVDPDRMTRFPIPGDHPEAGWLNPHRWVSREEYDEYAATRPSDGDAEQQLRMMLQAINPAMAQRISQMTDVQKKAARDEQAPEMQERMAALHQLGRDYWNQQTPREENR